MPTFPSLLLTFSHFFPLVSRVDRVFALFDVRSCNEVTKQDMKNGVQQIYRERQNLARSLRDSNTIIGTLDKVVTGALIFALIFVYLFIFGANVAQVLLSMSSIVLSLVFAVGNSFKRIFEAVVFLFVTHAYDVGDRIMVGDLSMVVVKINLLSTELRTEDDRTLYYPNYTLADQVIYNIRRSGNQRHAFTVMLPIGTELSVIQKTCELLQVWSGFFENYGGKLEEFLV